MSLKGEPCEASLLSLCPRAPLAAHQSASSKPALPRPPRVRLSPALRPTRHPRATAHSEQEALERVQRGLKAVVHGDPTPCVPVGTVTDQQPRPGARAPNGSTVLLAVVARSAMHPQCQEGVATADDRQLAVWFYRFARSPKRGDLPIILGFADTIVKQIPAAKTSDAEAWKLRPASTPSLPGPVSPLGLVAKSKGRYAVYSGPHPPACPGSSLHPPAELRDLHRVVIQPRQKDVTGCSKWWRVSLFYNDVAQLNGVTVNIWEP